VDVRGVSCYSSANLCDWKNEGLALGATPEDAAGDLHPSKVLERPKVIYNRATKQFVMWMHIDSEDYSAARCGVAVSGRPSGPFKYLGSFRPDAGYWPENASADDKKPDVSNLLARDFKGGQMARDLTLFVDDDGKAYLFYSSEENEAVHASVLTGDFLHTSGKYARIFVGRKMEAPVVFKRLGRYYFVASGCTAWQPNAARSAVADHPLGPWKELGNPCVGEGSETTFHSQGASVVPVQGRKDAYIFIADRWDQRDLAASSYLWLPLEFSAEGKPILRTGEWSSLSAFWRTNLTPRAE
jgi:hypothetical protein